MRKIMLLILFMPLQTLATPPECPLYATTHDCLQSVEENYKSYIDFIDQEYNPPKEELIEAANTIKKYETLACQKTCLN
ncbi:MAG: hypothetical protein JSR85_02120 [Proteobacteria bacterium]|nr:hypothetical protein [Pseudomonadota bacterium]